MNPRRWDPDAGAAVVMQGADGMELAKNSFTGCGSSLEAMEKLLKEPWRPVEMWVVSLGLCQISVILCHPMVCRRIFPSRRLVFVTASPQTR